MRDDYCDVTALRNHGVLRVDGALVHVRTRMCMDIAYHRKAIGLADVPEL
jgi:hypothetical protein